MKPFRHFKYAVLVLALSFLAAPARGGETAALKTDKDKVNYAIGVNIMGNFKHQGLDVDLDLVIRGMRDAAGGTLLLNDEELRKAIKEYFIAARKKQAEMLARKAEESKKTGGAPAAKQVPAAPGGDKSQQ